jgi:MFS family permease
MVFNFDARSLSGYIFAAILASLAVVPVAVSEQAATPDTENHEHISLRELARIVPTGFGTILFVGLAHGGLLGMAVIHATREGLSVGRVGVLIAVLQIGGMVLTWPIILAVLMLYQPVESIWTIVLLFAIGGFSFPLYAIAGAYTNDWVSPEQMGAAASQLVTLYGFGAMIGPLVAAPFLDIIGTQGFAWSIISLHALILLFLIYRIRAWHAPVTTKHWDDVSFHGRAFFIPATIVSLGVNRRKNEQKTS